MGPFLCGPGGNKLGITIDVAENGYIVHVNHPFNMHEQHDWEAAQSPSETYVFQRHAEMLNFVAEQTKKT